MLKTKATTRDSQDWQGPCVYTTMEIITLENQRLPIGQPGQSIGHHLDNMLDNARDNHQIIGKVTLDFTEINLP